jgi:hypothetical protein
VVEAEDYATGRYGDTTPGNSGGAYRHDDVDIESLPGGGYAVAYIRSGEWLGYAVSVNGTGAYRLRARVASPNATARVEVLVDDAPAFTVAVPYTGGYASFVDVEAAGLPRIAAGPHNLTVRFPVGFMNLDRLSFLAVSPVSIPGGGVPLDADGDGLYEDVNGNGRADFADVVLYFDRMGWISANEPVPLLDCNGNGRVDFADVVWLFNHL